jgi:hypothetical protein
MKIFILAALLLSSSAFAKPFAEERRYSHHLFITQKACEDAQRGMRFNCQQTIHFQADGTATVMMTDIMNLATYDIIANTVVVKAKGEGDMPTTMTFKLDRTQRNLISGGSEVWELDQGE